jgi:endonuclease/exonuclease/phosphatase family metal-dependent hydrolase
VSNQNVARLKALALSVLVVMAWARTAEAQTCATVTLSKTSFYSGAPASFWTVTIAVPTPGCTWSAAIDRGTTDPSAWLLLNSDASLLSVSGTGPGSLTLRTTLNATGQFRYGQFSIAGKSYKVTQEASAPPPDTTKPNVVLTAPSASATVSGITAVSATASDNVAVKSVQFQIDGVNSGAAINAPPYSMTWDTRLVSEGNHAIAATAKDAAGNLATATVGVTVQNVVPPVNPPGLPAAVTPADQATNTLTTVQLTWNSANATTYDVSFGTSNPPALVSAGQTTASYRPALVFSTTYYWQITAKNTAGVTAAPVWSFTTQAAPAPPEQPSQPAPADQAIADAAATLTWTAAGATSFDVMFGTTNPPGTLVGGLVEPSYKPALTNGSSYYWQVIARNAGGSTPGPVWSFTTSGLPLPSAAANPSPQDAATGIKTGITLSWSAATNAASYDVAFGTTNPPGIVASGTQQTSFVPPALAYGKVYYWQVVARNATGATPGPVWSFSMATAAGPGTSLKRLRVVTWNVQHGYTATNQHDIPAQIDLLASSNADVIVLEEITLADADMPTLFEQGLEARTGKNWTKIFAQSITGAPKANSEGNMILTWLPVDEQESNIVCAIPGDQSVPAQSSCTAMIRAAVTVNSVQVHIASVHLNFPNPDHRAYQFAQLDAWSANFGPSRLIAGDFNMEPPDPMWTAWNTKYVDVWSLVTGTTGDLGYTMDKRTLTNRPGRIDYMFMPLNNPRIGVQMFSVVKTVLSDHHLLMADYIIN